MKHIYYLIIALALPIWMHAAPIDRNQAQRIADRWMSRHVGANAIPLQSTDNQQAGKHAITKQAKPAYYVFNAENKSGFVMVCGDDRFPQILAYSDENCFPTFGEMPPMLKQYLESFSTFVVSVQSGAANTMSFEQTDNTDPTPIVGPLCTSRWDQGFPFNNLTPDRAVVGCVATAMAQIMYFHKWPQSGKGIIEYTETFGSAYADLSQSTYQWDLMKNTGQAMSLKPDAINAVSLLCRDCGYSVKMQYGTNGSGAYSDAVIEAMYKNFSYRPSTLRFYSRSCMDSQEQFNNIIKAELDQNRPFLFAAADPDQGGHAFVCDGYDSQMNVHINWGWAGSYDGFYAVPLLNPKSYNFTENQRLIMGIVPNYDNIEEKRHQYAMYLESAPKVNMNKGTKNQKINFYLENIFNITSYPLTWNVGVAIYDVYGNMIREVSVSGSLPELYIIGFHGYKKIDPIQFIIPSDLADGEYYLRAVFAEKGYDEWMLPNVLGGSHINRIPMIVEGNTLTFNQPLITGIAPIEKEEPSYYIDLLGRTYSKTSTMPARGLYIRGGKKILVR